MSSGATFIYPPTPARFGEPVVQRFHDEPRERHLQAIICFVNACGEVSISSRLVFENNRAENGQQLIEDALLNTTDFVRQRWTRIEVTTPMTSHWGGRTEGGYLRLLATREAHLIKEEKST